MAHTLTMQTEFTLPQTAKELGLSLSRTRQLVLEGRIPSRVVGPLRIVAAEDLQAFAALDRKPGRPRKENR